MSESINLNTFDSLTDKSKELSNSSESVSDYRYGQTMEKLPPWAVRVEVPEVNIAKGTGSRTTAQGVGQQTISCGFYPKMIRIEAVYADSSNGGISFGTATGTTDESCRYSFGATGANYFGASYDTGKIIYVQNSAGTTTRAGIYSVDADGFTLDWTTVGLRCDFQWEAIG